MKGIPQQHLLQIQVDTLFVTSRSGRIMRCAGPDRAPAPRLHLALGASGAIVRVRDDIDPRIADEIETLAAREFPLTNPSASPRFSDEYRQLLEVDEPLTDHHFGVIHHLPHRTPWNGEVTLVCHGTPEGEALVARIARDGMPDDLVDAGFVDLSHFWEPWCVALVEDKIASLAFAVRLGEKGAELGTMAAVGAARKLIEQEIAGIDGLVLANHNAPAQSVISGTRAAVQTAIGRLREIEVEVTELPVAAAFHPRRTLSSRG